jgi:hypothetical protein
MDTACCYQNTCSNENRIIWNRGWIVMRLVVAFVLLIAAVLKTHQLATTLSLGEGILHARWFNIFVVEFELFFGIWLIFGMLPKLSWFASVGLFSIFLIVSFYKAISGETSCGCFGEIAVNPWIMVVFDVVVIGLLLIFRPYKKQLLDTVTITNSKFNWFFQTLLITVILIFTATIQVYIFFGSFVGLNNFTNINEITFEIDKTFRSQKDDTVKIIVTNNMSRPITLVGAKTDCNCGKIEKLPVFVQPGVKTSIFFVTVENADHVIKAKQKQKILFFIDADGTKKYSVELPLFDFLVRR